MSVPKDRNRRDQQARDEDLMRRRFQEILATSAEGRRDKGRDMSPESEGISPPEG